MPLVWVRSHGSVEGLTLRRHARAEDHVRGDDRGPAGENLRGAGVRNCRLLADHAGIYDTYPHEWSTSGVTILSGTEDLVIENSLLRGSGSAIRFYRRRTAARGCGGTPSPSPICTTRCA